MAEVAVVEGEVGDVGVVGDEGDEDAITGY